MEPVVLSARGATWLADELDAGRDGILAEFGRRLARLGSPVGAEPGMPVASLGDARQILIDVSASVRAGEVLITPAREVSGGDPGPRPAADSVHPGELLQSSSEFFQIVLTAAVALLSAETGAWPLLPLVVSALEQSISARLRTTITGHTSRMLNQVREAQTSERRRIARDLHDRVGYGISVMHCQLELYSLHQSTDPARAAEKIEAARTAVQESMRSLRAVTSELYAEEIFGCLHTALMNYLESANSGGAQLHVRVSGDDAWAPPDVLDEVFLILREAAHNALRHARPATLVVGVDIAPHEIRASVEDDGPGFDTRQGPVSGGLGIASMRERAELLGGTLRVRSQAGQGTRVDFAAPLNSGPHTPAS